MAATVIHGKLGKVEWSAGAFADTVGEWTVTMTADISDVTQMHATNTSRGKLGGLLDWTATVEGNADDSGTAIADGTSAVLELFLTQTTSDGELTGTAIMMGVSQTQQQADAGKITYNFQGNGALTWAVA